MKKWPRSRIAVVGAAALLVCAAVRWASQPRTWYTVDAGPFTFSVPPDAREVEVMGIDSYVGSFKARTLDLGFDYGMWSYRFDFWPAGSALEHTTIHGVPATIGFRPSSPGEPGAWFGAAYFDGTGNLGMSATCRTAGARETARRIFTSVRFVPGGRIPSRSLVWRFRGWLSRIWSHP